MYRNAFCFWNKCIWERNLQIRRVFLKFTELAAMLPENNQHIQKNRFKKKRVEKVHLQNYVITQNTTTYLEIRKNPDTHRPK